MPRAVLPILLAFLALGCPPLETPRSPQMVPESPFSTVPPPVVPARQLTGYSAAPLEAAARLDTVGRHVLASNPQIGLKPLFSAIAGPQPEIFHVGTGQVVVTEGLIKQCPTDAQLAAVLCVELGKMVAAREAKADPKARVPERLPPIDVPVGNDNAGLEPSPDLTRLAELGRYEKERRRPNAPPPLPPDPQMLANQYLTKSGYPPAELDAVAPLLREAAKNNVFEKQFTAQQPARPWTP